VIAPLLHAALLLGTADDAVTDTMRPLHAFEMLNPSAQRLDGPRPPRVVLVLIPGTRAPPEMVTRLNVPQTAADLLVIDDVKLLHARDLPLPWHQQPSFFVDHDEKAFAPVAQESRAIPATTADLTAFIHRYIIHKNSERGLDPASVVARRREGDCTEHAVLLAALARSRGIPARVVFGIVLVQREKDVVAMGHAWVELRTGTTWEVGDAALHGSPLTKVYLPLNVVTDEGPAYKLAGLSATNIKAVKLEPR